MQGQQIASLQAHVLHGQDQQAQMQQRLDEQGLRLEEQGLLIQQLRRLIGDPTA